MFFVLDRIRKLEDYQPKKPFLTLNVSEGNTCLHYSVLEFFVYFKVLLKYWYIDF